MESLYFNTHRSETNGIADRAVRKITEGRLLYWCNQAWMKNGVLILCNAILICEMSKTSWQMGNHLVNGDLENHLKARFFPSCFMVEYHPISAKDQPRLHQFGKTILPGIFLGYALFAGGIWKGDVMVADTEELRNLDASVIQCSKAQCKRNNNAQKEWTL